MDNTKTRRRGQSVTLWLPDDVTTQLDRVLSRQVTRAALAGQIGRELPNRHAWIIDAVRAALAAEQGAQHATP